jgi:8-oxo-dGTP pyrophosphatase MutT (NUDIX family)
VETIDSTQVYSDSWLTVRRDTVRRADGSNGRYSVVDTADCAMVIPAAGDRLHLVEQYRHPVASRRWEFPSGSTDELDTDPAAAAARELREETGLVAGSLTLLGTLDTMPSTLNQQCIVFLATDLEQHAPQRELEEQDMQSAWFERSEVERMICDGILTDAKSVAAYALFLLRESR